MKRLSVVTVIALGFLACGRFGDKQKENKSNQRIVCVSKQLTEIIFAVGGAILHDINHALGFADRILFMKQGAIRFETGDANTVTALIIREIFDVDANIFYQAMVTSQSFQ